MTTARLTEWKTQSAAIARLAGPLVINNLAVAGMGFADAVMAGRLGAKTLAAVAVGSSTWFLAFTVGLGILMAISPIAAQLHGAGRRRKIGRYTRQGLYFALALGIPLIYAGQYAVEPALTAIGIDPGFRDLTVGYTKAILFGAPGMFMFLALRFTTEGIGHTRPIMYSSIFALACNVFLNWVFMYGNLGVPAMGARGCGIASAISMWLVMIALAGYVVVSPRYRELGIFSRFAPPRPGVLREIVVLGIPIAVTITAEAGLFNAVSILVGTLGATITAAHQIALNFAATLFMVPLGLSSAATIQVGQLIGAEDYERARIAGAAGIGLCGSFMTASAVFLLVFRDAVVSLYTDDPAVLGIALSLLAMVTIFQIADGVQIGAAAVLRGYKDTRYAMVINVFAYWVIAFPFAYMAAKVWRSPPNTIWASFVVGLTIAATLLTWRFVRLSRVRG
ncbi:MAG: MATE family efflux transporter [Proteobacteria bacterium]|nr:MATE family efflux transporter [Pseudomonadota bacterium]